MQIELWKNFSKRRNSTKTPADAGTTYEIYLKEDTDTDNPIVVLEPVDLGFTYARFLGNYYFVSQEVILTNNMMQLSLEMDPLASNKTDIGNTAAFIAYSSTGYDINKVDSRIGTSITKTYVSNTEVAMPLVNERGVYILNVANAGANVDGDDTGFTMQYVLCDKQYGQPSTMLAIKQLLMFKNWAEDLLTVFNDPYQSIISCIWLPLSYLSITQRLTQVNPFTSLQFGDKTEGSSTFFSLKKGIWPIADTAIPINWRYDDFRRNSPFTTLSLYIPLYGNIDLAVGDFIESANVTISGAYDLTTGDVILSLKNDEGAISQTINYNIASNCPIAQIRSNAEGVISGVMGTLSGGASTIGSVAGGQGALGAIGAVTSAQSAALSAMKRNVSIKGSIQGRAPVALGDKFILTVISIDTEDPDNALYIANMGRPVMADDYIRNHSGYIQCSNASFSGSVISSERDAINSFLNGGFYYE